MILKSITLFILWFVTLTIASCLAMSLILWQGDGIFWYGIGLIVSGVAFRKAVDWFLEG